MRRMKLTLGNSLMLYLVITPKQLLMLGGNMGRLGGYFKYLLKLGMNIGCTYSHWGRMVKWQGG